MSRSDAVRFDPRQEPWFDREAYPFADAFLEVDGGRMHYLDEGPRQGPPVLVVHGTPGWTFEFAPLIQALAAAGHRVIAPDHIGFGLSDRPRTFAYTLPAHTANLTALVRHTGIDRFDLVAHDFGGPIALPIVLDAPERVRRLVLINTWLWPFGSVDPRFARQRRLLASGLMRWAYRHLNLSAKVVVKAAWGQHRPLDARHHRHFFGMFPSAAHREGTVGFLRAMVEADAWLDGHAARLDQLKRAERALIVWGEKDSFVGPSHFERWRQALPDASVCPVPRAGHFPHDEARDVVIPRVRDFLAAP